MFYKLYEYLNKLFKLSFTDAGLEEKFQKKYIVDNLSQNIIAIKISVIAYLAYYIVAYYVTPEDFVFNAFFTLPIPLILAMLFLFSTNNKDKFTREHLFKLAIFGIGIGYPPVMNIAITEHYQQIYITNFMLPIFAAYVMYGAPFVVSTISIVVLLFIFAITLILFPMELSELIYAVFLISITFMISAISGYLIEKSNRKNYLAIFIQEDLNLQLKKEIEKNNQKEKVLQQQARLAQMGEMISMISHQWRQPLSAISSAVIGIQVKQSSGKYNLDIKEDRDKFLEFNEKKLNNIHDYVQTLSTTIDDFRNFFKPDKEKELASLSVPIKKALQIVESSLNSKNIKIDTEFASDESILMYPNEMMQVILNIIKNAEDNFVEKNITQRYLNIKTYKESNNLIISITDNGGGIPENILPNIFDPYFSTKDEKNGTGLGLYMSKIMVEEHNNGELNVYNIEDGVCFDIVLGVKNG